MTDQVEEPDKKASKNQWDKYRKKIEKIPESISATEVMDYVDQIARYEGYHDFRVNHVRLSEFCHPNSASRMLDAATQKYGEISRDVSLKQDASFSPGFVKVFEILHKCVYQMCDRFSQDLEAVYATCIPLPEQAEDDADRIPPPGSIVTADMFTGRIEWINPSTVYIDSKRTLATLSADQQRRAESVARILAAPTGITEQEWINLFRTNIDIKKELRTSEHMAAVFDEELNDRPNANATERRVVYEAIEKAVGCASIGDLLSSSPHLKSLQNLDRLFSRVKQPHRK